MKITRFTFAVLIALFVSFAVQEGYVKEETKAAEQAGNSWLSLVDAEKYSEAWKGFSTFFKERMTLEKWETQIKSVRAIFGKFENRKLKNATPTKTLPGAADGDYVVLQYDTAFEKKKSAIETVTVSLEKDGKWGVINYYIK